MGISSNPDSDEMKVKELINDIMAEKEVSEEKDSLISYEEISRDTETTFKKLLKEASKAPASRGGMSMSSAAASSTSPSSSSMPRPSLIILWVLWAEAGGQETSLEQKHHQILPC